MCIGSCIQKILVELGLVGPVSEIIEHPYVLIEDPLGALAHVGAARGYVLSGDTQRARAEYEKFLILWKDADTDVPIYRQAKAEYAELK